MSSVAPAGYGMIPTLVGQSAKVSQRLNELTEQASTGLASQTYAGLGGGASVALDLNAQVNTLQVHQAAINQATGSIGVTQTAMKQIQQIAATFASDIPNLNGLNPSEVDSIAAQANGALQQVADLLNTTDGNSYVFGGQDSANPPIPSPENILSSGFYTQIHATVSGLSSAGAGATAAATLAVAASNSAGTTPFSAYMSQPGSSISVPAVQTGGGVPVQIGLLASSNSVAVSSGTSTTGSYMRDLMRTLATLGSLSSSQLNDPGFGALVSDTSSSLNGAISAMSVDVGILGTTQSTLTTTQSHLADISTALNTQLNSVQSADMATTLSNLSEIQTQLQASYRMISLANSLSLVNFLPPGG